jgi:hypothetical protein
MIQGNHESGIKNSHYYFSVLKTNVDMYTTGIDKTLLPSQIASDNYEFLTQEIKDGLIDILDYWT